jgi:MFS family permease
MALLFASQTKEKPAATHDQAVAEKKARLTATNRGFQELAAEKSLYIPSLIMLCIGLVFGSLVTFLPLYIRELDIDFNTGLFYGAAAISSFGIRLLAGKASDTLGRGLFISGSLLCYAVTMILLTRATSGPMFMVAGAVEGIGAGVLIPTMIALMSDRSSSYERGKVYSFCIGGFDVGIALAGVFLGTITQTVGYQGGFAIAAGLAILAFGLFVTQCNPHMKSSLKFAMGMSGDRYAQKLEG